LEIEENPDYPQKVFPRSEKPDRQGGDGFVTHDILGIPVDKTQGAC